MIAIVTINLKIGEVEGLMNVCLPYLTLEDVIDKLNTKYWYSNLQNQDNTDYTESIETLIRRAQIPVKAVLGNSMISVNDFAMLQPGDIIRRIARWRMNWIFMLEIFGNLLHFPDHRGINMQSGSLR